MELENLPTTKPKRRWKRIAAISIASLLSAALLAIVIVAQFDDGYPDYVKGPYHKTLYYYVLPDNALAKEMFDKYRSARDSDMKGAAKEYLYASIDCSPSRLSLVDSLAKGFLRLARSEDDELGRKTAYNNAISLCKQHLEKDDSNVEVFEVLCTALLNSGKRDESYKQAEKLLMLDSMNATGIAIICRKYFEARDWKALGKWAEKESALEGEKAESRRVEGFYLKAIAEYHENNSEEALNTLNKADEKYKNLGMDTMWARGEAEIVRGYPFTINEVTILNTEYDGRVLFPGSSIRSYQTRYLTPEIVITPRRGGRFLLDIKLFQGGELSTGQSSQDGYSYSASVNVDISKGSQTLRLSGWGSEKERWKVGSYRFEIWWCGEKLATKSFEIY